MPHSLHPRTGALPGLPARLVATALLVAGLLLANAPTARAVAIAVNTTDDELNVDNDCSLREAVQAANTDTDVDGCPGGSGADAIAVPAGTYTLSLTGGGEDGNATGDLDIAGDVAITGAGQGLTILDGNDTDRVLHVLSGSLSLADLTVRNGRPPKGALGSDCMASVFCIESAEDGGDGGGIRTESGSALALDGVTVAENHAGEGGDAGDIDCDDPAAICLTSGGDGGYGGGISSNGTLTITHSIVLGNFTGEGGAPSGNVDCDPDATCSSANGSGGDGAGVAVDDNHLEMATTTVAGNTALGTGGGVHCDADSTCTITGSTINGNTAASSGGGLTIFFSNIVVENTTISGNEVTRDGGGVLFHSGTLDLRFVTIASNTTDDGEGGGIANLFGDPLSLKNSIIADNVDTGGESPDCFGAVTTAGYNHVESLTGCGFTAGTGDVTGSDPGLIPLAPNGGPTETQALVSFSIALDTIPSGTNDCGTTVGADQRGASRPTDGNADGTSACDKGAFELGGFQCGIQAAAEPATYSFFSSPDTVDIEVIDDGSDLDCLRVTDIPFDHPAATPVQMTGRYWIIETEGVSCLVLAGDGRAFESDCLRMRAHRAPPGFATGTPSDGTDAATPDYTVNLTLPFDAADAADTDCRYTGSGWDCAATSFVANASVTRDGIGELSDWAVGNNAAPPATLPTAASLLYFTATANPSGQVALEWETASEVDLAGFRVERAAATGEWRAVSPLIPALGDGATGARYRRVDAPGPGTHRYRLVIVHHVGPVEVHGPREVAVPVLRAFLPLVFRR